MAICANYLPKQAINLLSNMPMTSQSECLCRGGTANKVNLTYLHMSLRQNYVCWSPLIWQGVYVYKQEWGTNHWKVIPTSLPTHQELSTNEIAVFGITTLRNVGIMNNNMKISTHVQNALKWHSWRTPCMHYKCTQKAKQRFMWCL